MSRVDEKGESRELAKAIFFFPVKLPDRLLENGFQVTVRDIGDTIIS